MDSLFSGSYRLAPALLVTGLLSGHALGMAPQPKEPPLQEALQVVDSLRSVGDFRTALGWLYDLSEEHPGSVEVLWRYAILWSDYGKAAENENQALTAYRQALQMADRAIAADPNSAWVADLGFFKRMVVKTVYGGLPEASLQQAAEDLQRAVELESHTYSHLELGKVYLKMKRTEAAREQLQIALDVAPADPFVFQYKLEARALLHDMN